MPSFYKVPLVASPQVFSLSLAGITYNFTLKYCQANANIVDAPVALDVNAANAVVDHNVLDSWVMDISDIKNNPILHGIPLIPAIDLLYQYTYLGFGGSLFAYVNGAPDTVPTFAGLGDTGNLWFVTYP